MTSQQHDASFAKHRYTNIAAAFSLLAGLLLILGMVTVGSAVEKKASPTVHAFAAAPVTAAVVSGLIARSARRKAAALESPKEGSIEQPRTGDGADRPPPAA